MYNEHFIWNENKHVANIKKHGITFPEAATVFDDPNAVNTYDLEHSYNEDRFIVIGLSENRRLLMVCHCFRDGDLIRIISARKATKGEYKLYGGV